MRDTKHPVLKYRLQEIYWEKTYYVRAFFWLFAGYSKQKLHNPSWKFMSKVKSILKCECRVRWLREGC